MATNERKLGDLLLPTVYAGTGYTFTLADADGFKRFTSDVAVTATVPPNSSVAYPLRTQIYVLNEGLGQVTIAAGSGVTVNKPDSKALKIAEQFGMICLHQYAVNVWVCTGYLEPA